MVGQAVTSLGSTMAVKSLSAFPIQDASRGIYSHRLGDDWLVGGASNTGCAVFRKLGFSDEELVQLSSEIDSSKDSTFGSIYYPLCKPGERFPVNDPQKQPVLEPTPTVSTGEVDRRALLHGLLQSMAEIEKQGYKALESLGASPVTEVRKS